MTRSPLTSLLAALLLLAACGGGSTDPNKAAVGTYALVRVNGANLPAVVPSRIDRLHTEITGGTMTLANDQSLRAIVVFRETDTAGGEVEIHNARLEGTFTVSGSTVQIKQTGVSMVTQQGTLHGDTLFLTINLGIKLNFQKQ